MILPRTFIGAIAPTLLLPFFLAAFFLSADSADHNQSTNLTALASPAAQIYFASSSGRRSAPKPIEWKWTKTDLEKISQYLKKIQRDADGSYSLESDAWRIITFINPQFTAQVGVYMDTFATVFFKAFLLKSPTPWRDYKPQMVIYDSRDEYLRNGDAPEKSVGFCRPQWSVKEFDIAIFAYVDLEKKDAKEKTDLQFPEDAPCDTIQHEATHALLQCLYGKMNIPAWLNEGTAEYFGAWQPKRKISNHGEADADIDARRDRQERSNAPKFLRDYYARTAEENPRLKDLLAADTTEKFYAEEQLENARNYALAESFIDFLMTSKNRRPLLLKILDRAQKRSPELMTESEIKQYQPQWRNFLTRIYEIKFADKAKRKANSSPPKNAKK